MARTLSVCALLIIWPPLSFAQEKPKPAEIIVHMTVQPMAAPRLALQYQLLPELKEMNPGNPVLGYLKCFAEQHNFFFGEKEMENRSKWADMPLHELAKANLRGYGGFALRQADYAARLDTVDWQILLRAKTEGYNLS